MYVSLEINIIIIIYISEYLTAIQLFMIQDTSFLYLTHTINIYLLINTDTIFIKTIPYLCNSLIIQLHINYNKYDPYPRASTEGGTKAVKSPLVYNKPTGRKQYETFTNACVTNLGCVRGQYHTNNEQTQSVEGII